jgi:hypothetical protein
MAAPVINPTQSVLGFRQWEPWSFLPHASNTPTSWMISFLPPGVVFDTGTGRLDGPCETPGVFVFSLIATNGDGDSQPVVFALGIEPAGFVQPANTVEMVIDVTTKRVAIVSSGPVQFGTDDKLKPDPVIYAKAGDDLILSVRFTKAGVGFAMDLNDLTLSLKELEPEAVLATSSAWETVGTGADTVYTIHLKVDSELLRTALTNYEEDDGTSFNALAEIQWKQDNSGGEIVGPVELVGTTRTFTVMIPRDIVANA